MAPLTSLELGLDVKASYRRNSAYYRFTGATGTPERSVFADANTGDDQGEKKACEYHLLLFLHTLYFLRSSVSYRKKPYRAPCPLQSQPWRPCAMILNLCSHTLRIRNFYTNRSWTLRQNNRALRYLRLGSKQPRQNGNRVEEFNLAQPSTTYL
jgi:hypothetical protein